MNILFLKNFNNYTNRIVVKYNTLLDYTERAKSFVTYNNINFNPNDGVITELIVGSENQLENAIPLDWEKTGSPDYLVCFETTENIDSDSSDSSDEPLDTIISRWFIIECQRTRLGQYRLVLKRDVIADNLSAVEDATCLIEKGIVEKDDDPALYNQENIITNQIKSDEFLLKDETQSGWIVGYVAKDRDDGAGQLTPVTFTDQTIPGPEATDSACEEIYVDEAAFYAAHPELLGDLATLNRWALSVQLDVFYMKLFSSYKVGQTITYHSSGDVSWQESAYQHDTYLHSTDQGGMTMIWKAWLGDWRKTLANNALIGYKTTYFADDILNQIAIKEGITFKTNSEMQSFFNFIKREPVIKIGSKYYKPYDKYGEIGAKATVADESFISIGSTAYDFILRNFNRHPYSNGGVDNIIGDPGPETFKLEWSYNRHALGLREIFTGCKAKVPATVPVLKDAPYHMFAIPFSDDLALYEGNTLKCVTHKSVAMNAAQALAQQAGVGVVYDVQLLPYCPIRDIIKTTKVTEHAEVVMADELEVEQTDGTNYTLNGFFKLNTQYVLAKDINWTHAAGTPYEMNQYAFALKSDGVIYVKVGGTDLEDNPTVYQGKRFEVIKPNNLASEDPKIRVYSTTEPTGDPVVELSYNSYAAGNTLIGIYLTSDYYQGGYGQDVGHTSVEWYWLNPNENPSSIPAVASTARDSNPRAWMDGYIYYDNYYLTKVDISNAITSNIVRMSGTTETSDILNIIFWCNDSQFSFNRFLENYFLLQGDGSYKQDIITKLIKDKIKRGADVKDIKVKNQTDMLRLASPNYSNFFDMNIQKNEGIEYINVDCTYKPYQPYMHLNPNFKGLYGADYNDVRGLICGGDYSIALTTDAWATYQLQNKNYQAIFDRQIQQLEVQHSIQKESDVWGAVAGTVQGAASGAITGAMVGGGYGAIAGAVIGTVTSAVGGMADVYNNERIRELQISTTKDIHSLELANIKALPLGLSKTSYMTNNNKLFPFLEFYTCTATEDMAVRNLLDYNGMTINRIGKISEFQSVDELPYIKAKLIRIDIQEDAHQVQEIANELALGVYLPEGE